MRAREDEGRRAGKGGCGRLHAGLLSPTLKKARAGAAKASRGRDITGRGARRPGNLPGDLLGDLPGRLPGILLGGLSKESDLLAQERVRASEDCAVGLRCSGGGQGSSGRRWSGDCEEMTER